MEKEIKKPYVLAAGFTGMIFFGVAFVIMGAVLPSLIKKFALDTSAASTLAGLLPLGVLLGSLLFGPVIDRFGYKWLIISSSIVTISGLQMLAFVEGIAMVRFSIFLIGFGGGVLNGLTNALVSDISSDKDRASNLSILGVFYTVGAIAIPILFATLSKKIPYTSIISGAGVIMYICVLYFTIVNFPKAKIKQGFPIGKIISMAKEPAILLLSFTLFFQSGLEGISNNWIPTYLESEAGVDPQQAMLALTSIIVGIGVGRLVLGVLLRVLSKTIILIISMIIAAIGITVITLIPGFVTALAGTFMMGLGFASTFPIILGEIGQKYKEISGSAFSFALVIALIGNTLINLLVGVVSLGSFHLIVIGSAAAIIILYLTNLSVTNRNTTINK
ncbi:MAG: MFS transporter [Bacteroidetes bacterium HGW-Bacteroidetes-8]|jgi:fucose permease|nr:MAG: MFS transporter [Bacteroidetes bacterium HGW-Bacteroidetes-8]